MRDGGCPDARKLTNLVKDTRTKCARSGEGQTTASRRWLGRSPDGPGAEPPGKDFTPFRMEDSESTAGEGTGSEGREGGGTWGCLPSNSCVTSDEGAARPSEVRALMALLNCPSCIACLALLMLDKEEEEEEKRPRRDVSDCPASRASDHSPVKSPSTHLWRRVFTSCRISRQRSL